MWKIEGFDGAEPTGFVFRTEGDEAAIRDGLARLACRHLTDQEIVEATFGGRTDLKVEWRQGKHPSLARNGTAQWYMASEEDSNNARP